MANTAVEVAKRGNMDDGRPFLHLYIRHVLIINNTREEQQEDTHLTSSWTRRMKQLRHGMMERALVDTHPCTTHHPQSSVARNSPFGSGVPHFTPSLCNCQTALPYPVPKRRMTSGQGRCGQCQGCSSPAAWSSEMLVGKASSVEPCS